MTGGFLLALLAGPGPLSAQTAYVDDAAILSVLARVTKVEVECTGYAFDHATLPDTKVLAQRLRADHAAYLAEGQMLAKRLGVTLDPRIKSVVADSHAAILADMHAMSGINLDRTFVNHEVVLLQFAMNHIQRVMAPAAKSVELKDLLRRAIPLLRGHLALARSAKQQIDKA